ncbi:hypothetical protein C8R47DRAFT_804085 [Mycena vitilis]|nr:hypothetical protein C8R47DRAFT_804085 [Mycena vitilis]
MLASLEADRARVAELQTLGRPRSCISNAPLRNCECINLVRKSDSIHNKFPVLTLPNELVSEIFVRVLPPYPEFPDLIGPSSPNPLCQICRRWREVAMATPELWSTISSFDNNRHGRELRIFELWLEWSGHCPLSIKIAHDNGANKELVNVIIPHRARWQYLKIDLEDNLQMLDGPMPFLRHLEVALSRDTPERVSLLEVPLLRTVTLENVAALRIVLPWAQLTSLTLLNTYPSDCVPILVQAHNLVHCELDLFFDEFNIEPRRDITLPHLQSLVFPDSGVASVTDSGFLSTLFVPALRSLEIAENFIVPNLIELLTAFISRSGCRLQELRITGTRLLPQQSYRQAFPFLSRLSFDREMASDGDHLTDSASSED